MDLRGARVVVVGLGSSGRAAARLLVARGAVVSASDMRPLEALREQAAELAALGVAIETGGHTEATFKSADLVVLSPGVPETIPAAQAAAASGAEIIGEFELACRHTNTPIAAVTGTNGKTTTTKLLAHLMAGAGRQVFCGGNVGTPLSVYAAGPQEADLIVAEVSSFQLDTCTTFHPRVAVLLNVTPDHLDRYAGMEAYARSKSRIFMNQGEADYAVVNEDDPWTPTLRPQIKATVCGFSSSRAPLPRGAYMEGSHIHLSPGVLPQCAGHLYLLPLTFPISSLKLKGRHNLENAMAALLAAACLGADPEALKASLATFAPLAHRCEPVRTLRGVTFYNDSKGTNVDAVVRALQAVEPPVVLIAGGRDKGGGYRELACALPGRVVAVVVMGEAAPMIAQELGGLTRIVRAHSMEEAVAEAAALSPHPGSVLLSPACSSFDMYENYAARGAHFRRVVEALA